MDKENLQGYKKKLSLLNEKEKQLRDVYLSKLAKGEIQGPQTGYASIDKPWLKYYEENNILKNMNHKTVYQLFYENSKDNMDKVAINYYDKKIKFEDLFKKIDDVSKSLYSLGLREGDTITLLSVTLPETIYLMYAANKIGVCLNVMDPRTNISRIKKSVEETNSKCVFVIDQYVDKIVESIDSDKKIVKLSAADSLPTSLKILYNVKTKSYMQKKYSNVINFKEFEKKGKMLENVPSVSYKKDRIAFIDYTGGTTGTPKGALLTDDSVNAISEQYKLLNAGIEEGQSMLNIMPMFLAYGINMLNMSLNVGVTNILIPVFDPNKFADYLIKYHPNHFMGVPMHFETLLNNPKMDGQDLSWFITPAAGGDSTNVGLEDRINIFLREHNAPSDLIKGYGMTELSSAAITGTYAINARGSVGIPLIKNNVMIINPENQEEIEYGEIGEICINSPSQMLGYLNNIEETNKTIKQYVNGEKWIHTGDLGYVNKDGMFFIVNRKKRVIIRPDGHNVFPSAIENIITRHKAVKECVVIGVGDSQYINGKWTKAVIVLEPEYIGRENEVEEQLKKMCLDNLPERDVASTYSFRDSLPYTASQKIDVISLEKEYETKNKILELKKK